MRRLNRKEHYIQGKNIREVIIQKKNCIEINN